MAAMRICVIVIVVWICSTALASAQFVQQGPLLAGTGAVGFAGQGCSVALSYDGNTAIVGGLNDNNNAGAIWVWVRSGGVWHQQGNKLVGSGAVGNLVQQGFAVALSGDGDTAIVGGHGDNNNIGAVWIWTRTGGHWIQQGPKLVGNDSVGSNVQQGGSVALSHDGNTAIAGGPIDDFDTGAVWVWTRTGADWSQQGAKLVAPIVEGNVQGWSVSLSADGNTALVGGPTFNGTSTGGAWVWIRTGTLWRRQGSRLTGAAAVGLSRQGSSVALSADASTALIGGPADDDNVGATWTWARTNETWTQEGPKLIGGDFVGSPHQAFAVSISDDGATAAVGGPFDDGNAGAVWLWSRSRDGHWTQIGNKITASEGGKVLFGKSVAVSGDGNTVIIGDDNGAAVYVRDANGHTRRRAVTP